VSVFVLDFLTVIQHTTCYGIFYHQPLHRFDGDCIAEEVCHFGKKNAYHIIKIHMWSKVESVQGK
jgi:hypothetical protein